MSSSSGFKSFAAAKPEVNDAFSKPIVRRRFQTTQMQQTVTPTDELPSVTEEATKSPGEVFSPPVSIPETSSDGNNLSSSDGSDSESTPTNFSQSSTSSLNRKLESSKISTSTSPPKIAVKKRSTATYEFDEDGEEETVKSEPVQKKMKEGPEENGAKFIPKKETKLVYQHKWTSEDLEDEEDEEEDEELRRPTGSRVRQPILSAQQRRPIYSRQPSTSSSSTSSFNPHRTARVRNVKDSNEILESGEYDDFKQDVVYILSTLNNKNSSINVKNLSTISLAKKCVLPDFRQFLNTEQMMPMLFKSFAAAPENPLFALTASSVIYLLYRDFNSIKLDFPSLKVLAQLLRIENLGDNEDDSKKIVNQIWDVFQNYAEKQEYRGKKITFDMKKEYLTASNLILESLVFITARCSNDENLKTELVNLSILQYCVAKVEKMVKMIREAGVQDEEAQKFPLHTLDRCFRILDTASSFHKKNQAFLVSHRSSTLINVLAEFLKLIHEHVPKVSKEMSEKYMNCLSVMANIMINLSHENELCSSKFGQIPNFIVSSLASITHLAPLYAHDKRYDISVLMTSFVVNLVERCNTNRKKLITTPILVCSPDGKVSEQNALEAIAKLFVHHESNARTTDEDLDNDLAFEEKDLDEEDGNDSDSDNENNGTTKDGRLNRKKLENMDQNDVFTALNKVMTKASVHMEDSILASHYGLLIGCLLNQNEEYVDTVREVMPDKNLTSMASQLQRFHDFLKVTTGSKPESEATTRSIEKIIDIIERLE